MALFWRVHRWMGSVRPSAATTRLHLPETDSEGKAKGTEDPKWEQHYL